MIYVVEDDEGMQEVYEGAFEENYQTRISSKRSTPKNPTL